MLSFTSCNINLQFTGPVCPHPFCKSALNSPCVSVHAKPLCLKRPSYDLGLPHLSPSSATPFRSQLYFCTFTDSLSPVESSSSETPPSLWDTLYCLCSSKAISISCSHEHPGLPHTAVEVMPFLGSYDKRMDAQMQPWLLVNAP